MATVQQRVLNWLYSVLTSEYQDVNRTYNDVAQTLSHYSSLAPKTEVFTYETGASALLLQLSGTLPVNFRGTTYRFPVSLWIPHAYPREAPLAYVTPAEGMVIRAGQHVDPQGKVYHPYLVGWAEFWDKSNILDFLAILRDVFAKEPPVVSRQQRNAPPGSTQPTSIPPPLPPHPPDISSNQSRQPTSPNASIRPPPPPKRHDASRPPPSSVAGNVGRSGTGPPVPPLPQELSQAQAQGQQPASAYQNGHQPIRQSSLRYETAPPLPSQPKPQDIRSPPYSPPNAATPYGWPGPQMHPQAPAGQYSPGHAQPTRSGSGPYPQSYPHQPQPNLPGRPPQWQQPLQQTPIQQRAKPLPPPDLIDSPLTIPTPEAFPLTAPPIPPNPEKDLLLHRVAQALHAQRQHSLSQTASSLPGLRAQRSSMLSSLTAMTAELHTLDSLSALLTSNTSILHASLRDADAVVKSSQGRAPPAVDEILVAPTVVGNQLYDLVSEERSLADALFVLSRAVEKGRVTAGVFAKATRALAREWYLKKALVKKIGRGMGLVTEQSGYGW